MQALQALFQCKYLLGICVVPIDTFCRFKENGDADKKKDISCLRNSVVSWESWITFLAVLILDFLFGSM